MEKVNITIRSVLSGKRKIAIIIGWIITGIAIAWTWRWATGSPLEILIPVSMGVVFVAVFIVLAITTMGRSEEEEVERVVEILKRAKRIKEEIERRGENLTREYDIILAQVLSGLNDLKSWSLLILSAILAFGIAILTMR
jgi:uncharacterized membrane protein